MHIKHIHDMIEKLSECAKVEMDKGIEQIDAKELGEVAEIIKELAEAEYYAKISKAMDESEYGEDYDEHGPMDDKRRGYRGQPRDSMGRYMSRRGRRGYVEPMAYTMTPEMYHAHTPEWYRDMDRENMGRMYYSDGGNSSSGSSRGGNMSGGLQGGSRGYSENDGGQYASRMQREDRDSREGRAGEKRKGYMESREQGKDKGEKMRNLEEYMKELGSDFSEMVADMSPEEKSLMKQKLQVLTQKIS